MVRDGGFSEQIVLSSQNRDSGLKGSVVNESCPNFSRKLKWNKIAKSGRKWCRTQTDCFRIVFAKILRKDIRLGSGGFRKLHEIEQDLGDFTVADDGSVGLNVFAKTNSKLQEIEQT